MPEYSVPGVFVREIEEAGSGITTCPTAVTALVGHVDEPGFPIGDVVSFEDVNAQYASFHEWPDCPLKRAVLGFFHNGGERLYVLNIGANTAVISAALLSPLNRFQDINLVAAPGYIDPVSQAALITHCEGYINRFAVLDGPAEVDKGFDPGPQAATGKAALYLPWVLPEDGSAATPPSGHVCGAFARQDTVRGVWTAPANLNLEGVIGLSQVLTDEEQQQLNAVNVNALRMFAGRGVNIWGARTRAPQGHDMRYVSERRLKSMVEHSLTRGTAWAAFEPNTEPTWSKLRRQIALFLTMLWHSGALVGQTAEQSFFVRCGPETMSQSDLDQGRLICDVGVAMLNSAEFSVLQIKVQTTPGQAPPSSV